MSRSLMVVEGNDTRTERSGGAETFFGGVDAWVAIFIFSA